MSVTQHLCRFIEPFSAFAFQNGPFVKPRFRTSDPAVGRNSRGNGDPKKTTPSRKTKSWNGTWNWSVEQKKNHPLKTFCGFHGSYWEWSCIFFFSVPSKFSVPALLRHHLDSILERPRKSVRKKMRRLVGDVHRCPCTLHSIAVLHFFVVSMNTQPPYCAMSSYNENPIEI